MIPFEREVSLNKCERRVEELLENNWSYVVRSTPGIRSDLVGRFPEISETISRKIKSDAESDFSNIFRPGVPDFLAFSDTGDYVFVEAKSESDGLRHTQLKWLRDFQGVNVEIWFAESENDVEKLSGADLNSYGFQDVGNDSSECIVEEDLKVGLPNELAAITNVSEGDSVSWRLKNKDELILNTK